jgi:hypothetical protein
MNTPEQNDKNLFEIKKFIAELLLTLSLAWTGCWFMTDSAFYPVAMLGSVLFVKMLSFFKITLIPLYVLSAISLVVAILVTNFIP